MKYIILSVFLMILGYFSIKIQSLTEYNKSKQKFEPKVFANDFVSKTLPSHFEKAQELTQLLKNVNSNPQKTFKDFSHANSIGNLRYFLVKGQAKILKINEDDIEIDQNGQIIKIETEFLYGSTIREASGAFDIKKFTNSGQINDITTEINKLVKNKVIAKFKKNAKIGDSVNFIGALELNQEHPNTNDVKVLPISLTINK